MGIVKDKGEITWISVTAAPIPLEGYGVAIAYGDITERKRAEEELRFHGEIMGNMSEGVYLIRLSDGLIVYTNPKFERMFGYEAGEMIGKPVTIVIAPTAKSPEETAREIIGVLNRTGGWYGEINNIKKDGTPFWCYAGCSLFEHPEYGKVIVAVHTDINERKRTEEGLKNSHQQLRDLASHLQSVREEERKSIAREIHDELGQALTVLKMDLSWLRNKLTKNETPLVEKTESMSKLIDATVQTMKRISTELRPGLLDDLGITAAIEWQAEEFQNRTGIKCNVNVKPEEIILDEKLSTAIFRVFQETLINVARHANATRVKASLVEKVDKLELKVRDNGKGIAAKHISNPKSFGLIGMRERVHPWGGEFKIEGKPREGTTVRVTIPLNRK
jgi:PAS domain S-box-containing protein